MSDASGKPENAQEKVAISSTSTVTSLGFVKTAMGTVEEREAGNVIEGGKRGRGKRKDGSRGKGEEGGHNHGTRRREDTRCYMHIPCTVMMAVAEAEPTVFTEVQL